MSSRRRNLQLKPTSGVDETPSTILVDRIGHTYRYTVARRAEGATIVAVGATLLGMISVGLAELQSYHLIVRSRVPPPVAVATTIAVVLAAVAAASVGHLYNLTFGHSAGGLAQVLPMLVFTIPGVVAAPCSSAGSPPTTAAPSVVSCISGTRVTPGCSGF